MKSFHRFSLLAATAVFAVPAHANAAGCPIPGFSYAAFGDAGVDVGNGNTDSYDSQSNINYNTSKCASNPPCVGGVATNATGSNAIQVKSPNGNVDGTCTTGFGGALSDINGASQCDASAIGGSAVSLPVPTLPSGTNTSIVSPLAAGNYSTASISLSGTSTIDISSGPVVIYLTGSGQVLKMTGNGAINNNTQTPSNVLIMCTSSVTPQTIDIAGNGNAYYGIYCPKADITIAGNGTIYGAIVGKSVSFNGNNGFVHYDKALANLASNQITCGASEVSRATPIVASLEGNPQVIQGTYEYSTSAPKTITTVADVANFEFPFLLGHMRARLASSVSTSASSFSAGTILFDASTAIPAVVTAGCALGTNSNFTTTCRNIFTNTNTAAANGTTTFTGTPTSRITLFSDTNATAIGSLIAPTGNAANQVPGIGSTEWTTIVRRVLKGQSGGTVAKLGGVDRSTVAVIGPSSVAGVNTRPTMTYFGGTDGMLHAVCSSTGGTTASTTNVCPGTLTGTELWAFVPRVQLPLIRTNKQRIDGSVRVVDAFGTWPDPTSGATSTTKTWRTILTFQTGFSDSSLGATPGVYALDVTDPAKPILLWEYVTPSSGSGAKLGVGLAMHAGPTLIGGLITNLAVAQTNNGGSGGAGVFLDGFVLETGVQKWTSPFSYIYTSPRPSTQNYDGAIPATGVPGGAVGADLLGTGFTTDIVMGDLYGDLWRIDAATGVNTTAASKPLFSFATDRHPIGGLPAILDNGNKIAIFGSGAYVDPTGATQWTVNGTQKVIGVKIKGTTSIDDSSSALAFNIGLTGNTEKINSQLTVVGTEVFLTTDTTDFNATTYGSTGASTGNVYKLDTTAGTPALALVNALQGGASSVTFNGANSTLVGGAADKTQQVAGTATTSGATVDYYGNKKTTRLVWLRSAQ